VNAGGRGNETMVGWQTMDTGESWLDGLDWTSVEVGQHASHKVLSPSIILVCQIQENLHLLVATSDHDSIGNM
jgi:hypothetical protein